MRRRTTESPKLQQASFIVVDRFGSIIHAGDSELSDEALCDLIGLDPEHNSWADRMGGMAGWGFIISSYESGEYAKFIN